MAFLALSHANTVPHTTPDRRGFWRILYDAAMLARQRAADRDAALFVMQRGKFTDELERELSQRTMRGDWGPRD
ncbi:MAG: hypothetical protein JO205_04325 [Pseudolabrys sp.]|nr:hypothetical protein [Pseudolabrys sp.]